MMTDIVAPAVSSEAHVSGIRNAAERLVRVGFEFDVDRMMQSPEVSDAAVFAGEEILRIMPTRRETEQYVVEFAVEMASLAAMTRLLAQEPALNKEAIKNLLHSVKIVINQLGDEHKD
jgi:hypothetical protein